MSTNDKASRDQALNEMLGIDLNDPLQRLAEQLAYQDSNLMWSLVEARKTAGLTQQDVADRLGVALKHVIKMETYYHDPRLSSIRRYALAVGALVEHKVTTDVVTDIN